MLLLLSAPCLPTASPNRWIALSDLLKGLRFARVEGTEDPDCILSEADRVFTIRFLVIGILKKDGTGSFGIIAQIPLRAPSWVICSLFVHDISPFRKAIGRSFSNVCEMGIDRQGPSATS